MIILKDICKKYNEKVVLDKINLTFKKGKINCILGYSGVGKTTLLNILVGLENYQGEIIGLDDKIAYAFQTPCLIENLSVLENISIISSEINESEIKNCLEKLELGDKINLLAKNLSVGEKQRINFLRAILYFPKILILDESFSSLDVKSKLLCEKLLIEYKNKCDFTVIMVTHDYSLALSLADEIFILSPSKVDVIKVKKDDENDNILTEKQLKDKLLSAFNV